MWSFVVILWEFFPLTVAVVGLEHTFYSVEEGPGAVVEVCAVVYQPTGSCPIGFDFTVDLTTSDITAGSHVLQQHCLSVFNWFLQELVPIMLMLIPPLPLTHVM